MEICTEHILNSDGLTCLSSELNESELPLDAPNLAGMREVDALLVSEDGCAPRKEVVAVEMRIDLMINGRYWASTACTPSDLIDYAQGALFSSGVIETSEDVLSIKVSPGEEAITVAVELSGERGDSTSAPRPASATKALHVPTGTVFPGYTSPSGVAAGSVEAGLNDCALKPAAIWKMSRALLPAQGMHQATGATHAAVFADREGHAILMREDVGRHNAVDKLVGAMLRSGVNPNDGFVYLSSRCALELVAKCARIGVRLVATVSAPTTAVLDFATRENITLCAFARNGRFTVYTHPERIAL